MFQGFDVTHQDINLLRLKSFTVGHNIKDEELTNEDTVQTIADLIGSMVPFVSFHSAIVSGSPELFEF